MTSQYSHEKATLKLKGERTERCFLIMTNGIQAHKSQCAVLGGLWAADARTAVHAKATSAWNVTHGAQEALASSNDYGSSNRFCS